MTDALVPNPKKSVTLADQLPASDGPGFWQWVATDSAQGQATAPGLPRHWSMARDVVLSATPFLSDFWAAALRTAVNQIVVRPYTVKDSDDSARRLERSQNILLDFGGVAMYSESMAQTAQDFFTTDQGALVEIEYEGLSRSGVPTGRPVALHHLDSLRCWPTGNRAWPIVYVDYWGGYHKVHASALLSLTDQPSPRLGLWGVGRCAASDAWRTIVLDGAIQVYLSEKITGSRALKLAFVKGVSPKRMEDSEQTAQEAQARKGRVIYRGVEIIPVMDDVVVAEVDLAGVPDGFDPAQIHQRTALVFALALGMPYTDIATLQGGQFGTGTQSQVIDESRKGRGVEAFVKTWERKINRLVMPKRTTVDMFGADPRDQKAEADVKTAEAGYVEKLVTIGVATPAQAGNYLADNGWWPTEFVQEDQTTGGALTDSGESSKLPEALTPEEAAAARAEPSALGRLAATLQAAGKAAKKKPAPPVITDAVRARAAQLLEPDQ